VRAPAEKPRIEAFLTALGHELRHRVNLYLGGTILVDKGLRKATLGIDYVVRAESPEALDEFERLIPRLKNRLNVNAEPASPADFMPVRRGALEHARFVRRYGQVTVFYYDRPSVVLSKVARGSQRDLADIELLVCSGMVRWDEVEAAWAGVRSRETGWLRHTPEDVERHLELVRDRLGLRSA
jgi:hypothetical protein